MKTRAVPTFPDAARATIPACTDRIAHSPCPILGVQRMGCCALVWQVSMLLVKQQLCLCICAANNTMLPPRYRAALHIHSPILFHAWPQRHDPPRIPFPFFACLLLLVIKVASLMRFESGDKVAVGGALTVFYPRIFEIDHDFNRVFARCKQGEEVLC